MRSTCLCLLNVGIKGVYYCTWMLYFIYFLSHWSLVTTGVDKWRQEIQDYPLLLSKFKVWTQKTLPQNKTEVKQ